MFTGIVEELGTVAALTDLGDAMRLTVTGPTVVEDAALDDSIAVNGCCLTVTAVVGETWSADVIATTLAATTLGTLRPGDRVNLERCVRADGRLDGHIVQGHVDGTATVAARDENEHWTTVRFAVPRGEAGATGLTRYVVEKGSIAVDGVSLTVSAVSAATDPEPWFEVSLIPTTLRETTLGTRAPGDPVNLEVDVIAKHVERLLQKGIHS